MISRRRGAPTRGSNTPEPTPLEKVTLSAARWSWSLLAAWTLSCSLNPVPEDPGLAGDTKSDFPANVDGAMAGSPAAPGAVGPAGSGAGSTTSGSSEPPTSPGSAPEDENDELVVDTTPEPATTAAPPGVTMAPGASATTPAPSEPTPPEPPDDGMNPPPDGDPSGMGAGGAATGDAATGDAGGDAGVANTLTVPVGDGGLGGLTDAARPGSVTPDGGAP
jgi:hypothetical protein